MNKIEALNENAIEAAVLAHDKEEAAMRGEPDPWADERPEDEFADRKAAMAEAIRAYLSAAASDVSGLVERLDTCAVATFPIVQEAATTLTDLEAENARLRAEVERLEVSRAFWKRVSNGWSQRTKDYKACLAEALKALEPFAEQADNPQWWNDSSIRREHLRAARRVREGGKVE